MQSFAHSLPLYEILHRAVLDGRGALQAGDRVQASSETCERRQSAGGVHLLPRAHYDVAGLPEGAILVVLRIGGRYPIRALAVRDGACMEIPESEAADVLDPAGARRRAWRRRVLRTTLTSEPVRYRMELGHAMEAGFVYDWCGVPDVAACNRATPQRVWVRAATYEEAEALGIA